jgi:choline dehydrogenase-like flavoprotein
MSLVRTIKSLAEAQLKSISAEDLNYLESTLKREVLPNLDPKVKRLLNLLSLALELSPIPSTLRLFSTLSIERRRKWLETINVEGTTYDITILLDTLLMVIHMMNPRVSSRINYKREEVVSKIQLEPRTVLSRSGKPQGVYDVVIVGSGAGGAVVAWELVRREFKVALFEVGPEPTQDELIKLHPFLRAFKYYWDNGFTFTWGKPIIDLPFGRVLGGTVTVNSGTMFRMPDEALGLWYKASGITIDSGALNSAYETVERMLGVKQVPENLLGGNAMVMRKGAEALGLKLHGPVRRPLGDPIKCRGVGECAFGCPSNGKVDMRLSFLKEAVNKGLEVYTHAFVRRVLLSDGKALGVEVELGGTVVRVESKVVVVSAGALNTPRLLLTSGVKNRNLGAHLHIHPGLGVTAIMDQKVYGWIGTMQSYYVADLLKDFRVLLLATLPPPGIGFSTGSIPFDEIYDYPYIAAIGVQVSDDGTGIVPRRTILGVANYDLSSEDLEKIRRGIELSAEILLAAGAKRVYLPLKVVQGVNSIGEVKEALSKAKPKMFKVSAYHPMSTARMAKDPGTGVVDGDGRVFGYSNLYVADASVLPSTTIVNPQLTINALSLIIAQRIAKELGG